MRDDCFSVVRWLVVVRDAFVLPIPFKPLLPGFVLALATASAAMAAARIGDTYEEVIKNEGAPERRMEAGGMLILYYPTQTVKLRNGQVVSLAVPPPSKSTAPAASAPVAGPATTPAPGNYVAPNPNPQLDGLFPKNFVGHPQFDTQEGKRTAGIAFLARREDRTEVYILTARRMLGPEGGFPAQVTPENMRAFMKGISLRGLFGGILNYDAKAVTIPTVEDATSPTYDLAIFRSTRAMTDEAAVLAGSPPRKGEAVWLIAAKQSKTAPATVTHTGAVVAVGDWIVCQFQNPQIVTNDVSGAPVINARGQIVGIYSTFADQDGDKFAYIIPAALVRKYLN